MQYAARLLLICLAFVALGSITGQAQVADFTLNGFRAAQFGMTLAQTRAAIASDYQISDDDIVQGRNPLERTDVLSVSVPDLLEGGGTAEVSYVFGYKSQTLIQIGISWSAQGDPDLTPARLIDNGQLLQAYLRNVGYQPDSLTLNSPVEGGIILFRGADPDQRTALLILQQPAGAGPDAPPAALTLLYTLDPAQPDIFRIEEGQF